jgi:ABC-type Na+ efflux pump permease subunit
MKRALDKAFIVARSEYLSTVRTRAFLVALFLLPILSLGAMSLPLVFENQMDREEKRCAVIDDSGVLLPRLQQRAARKAELAGQEFPASGKAGFVFEQVEVAPGRPREALLFEQSERVRTGELFAFIEIPAVKGAALHRDSDPSEPSVIRYYSQTPTYTGLQRWLKPVVEDELFRLQLIEAGVPSAVVELKRPEIQVLDEALLERRGDSWVRPEPPDPVRDLGLPIGAALLMFSSVMLGVGPLMQSALEEKMQRIAEVLVSSVPPFQLLLGKLLGASAVSYTLLTLYGAAALALGAWLGLDLFSSPGLWVKLVLFQAVAVVMYGAVFLAVGSACNDLKESQALMMPVMIVVTSPLLLMQLVFVEPNGTAATVASFFPPFTPVLMLLRSALEPGAPGWQVAAGGGLSFAAAVGCLWAASRVFRVGMLVQGGVPSYRTVLSWIRRG